MNINCVHLALHPVCIGSIGFCAPDRVLDHTAGTVTLNPCNSKATVYAVTNVRGELIFKEPPCLKSRQINSENQKNHRIQSKGRENPVL